MHLKLGIVCCLNSIAINTLNLSAIWICSLQLGKILCLGHGLHLHAARAILPLKRICMSKMQETWLLFGEMPTAPCMNMPTGNGADCSMTFTSLAGSSSLACCSNHYRQLQHPILKLLKKTSANGNGTG